MTTKAPSPTNPLLRISHLPSYAELLDRIEQADNAACDGSMGHRGDDGCRFCKSVIEDLRGGSITCDRCGHINAILHSCSDWKEYDERKIDLNEIGRRMDARERAVRSGSRSGIGHQIIVEDRG